MDAQENLLSEHHCAVCGMDLADDNMPAYECEHCINLAEE